VGDSDHRRILQVQSVQEADDPGGELARFFDRRLPGLAGGIGRDQVVLVGQPLDPGERHRVGDVSALEDDHGWRGLVPGGEQVCPTALGFEVLLAHRYVEQ